MAGDLGAVATLLNTLAAWALSPDGYQKVSREIKLARLREGLVVALDNQAWDAADLIMAEYRKLSSLQS
jgi:hypothetical protein